jgi:hypothetical protein
MPAQRCEAYRRFPGNARWQVLASPRRHQRYGSDQRPHRAGRHHGEPAYVGAGRQLSELHLQEFEIVDDPVQVATGLVDPAQRELAIIWHERNHAGKALRIG